jgi:hypothetical protein
MKPPAYFIGEISATDATGAANLLSSQLGGAFVDEFNAPIGTAVFLPSPA